MLANKKINKGDIVTHKSYGFAPIETGITGPSIVTEKDTTHYENPYYSRTIEITKLQHDKISEFGKTAVDKSDVYFKLDYNGATNSCIDFTWKALRHAGLTPKET
ncbi:hypothetical protein M2263_003402 [Providencia alcalifaciens]|nr:hypothetical protein [Providencia alcalifaciens]